MCLLVAQTGRNLMGFRCTGGDMLLQQDGVNFYWCLNGLTLMDPEKYAPESVVPRRNYICLTVKDQMNKIELLLLIWEKSLVCEEALKASELMIFKIFILSI